MDISSYRSIGNAKTLKDAEQMAQKNKGNEIIVYDKKDDNFKVVTTDEKGFDESNLDYLKAQNPDKAEKSLMNLANADSKKYDNFKIVEFSIDRNHNTNDDNDAIFIVSKELQNMIKKDYTNAKNNPTQDEKEIMLKEFKALGNNNVTTPDEAFETIKSLSDMSKKGILSSAQTLVLAKTEGAFWIEKFNEKVGDNSALGKKEKAELLNSIKKLDPEHFKHAFDIFKSYANSPKNDALMISRIKQINNKTPLSFEDSMKLYNDPGTAINGAEKLTTDSLKNKLGDEKWATVATLVKNMESNKMITPETLAYIEKIANTKAPEVIQGLTETINNFIGPKLTDLFSRLDKKELIKDLLHDIAYPSNIYQGGSKLTCTSAALQMKLAIDKPVEYAKMLTTLAQGKSCNGIEPNDTWLAEKNPKITDKLIDNLGKRLEGKADSADIKSFIQSLQSFKGKEFKSIDDLKQFLDTTLKIPEKLQGIKIGVPPLDRDIKTFIIKSMDDRSLSCKIMENAFMQAGAGTSYESKGSGRGLSPDEKETSLKAVFGNDYSLKKTENYSVDQLYKEVEDDIARGRTVSIGLKGREDHAVLVVGMDKEAKPPTIIMNSWGKQYSMTIDEFKQHVKNVIVYDDKADNEKIKGKVIIGD